MEEIQATLNAGPPNHDMFSPTPAFSGFNIPQEDWDHARALLKYPPHVILFIARELLCCQSRSTTMTASSPSDCSLPLALDVGTSPTPSKLSYDYRIAIAQLTAWEKDAPKQQENRWFCVFDEHKDRDFGKPSDWKKHMNSFHEPGKKAWQCPEKDCAQTFDKANNFCQHHRKEHGCRKSCTHADGAKKKNMNKRAFACGRESCQSLLFSWGEWLNHVTQHMEDGMTRSQWQYNTLFRNLLRRPEVHRHWETIVAKEVYPYNILSRFTWRPRNTSHLKTQLEYMDSSDLLQDGYLLALQAYENGTSVRSAQEISDSSPLIAEPCPLPMTLFQSPFSTIQPQNSCLGVFDVSHAHPGSSPFPPRHQESQDFRPPLRRTPSTPPSAASSLEANFDFDHFLDFDTPQSHDPPVCSMSTNLHNQEDIDMAHS